MTATRTPTRRDRGAARSLGLKVLAWVVSALAVFVAIMALRSQTLSTHYAVPPESQMEVVVDADTRAGESSQSLHELAMAQVLSCRLEVQADAVDDRIEPIEGDHTRFRFLLQPSLDKTDRRQFRGCIEDWRIDHLRLRVVEMVELSS